MRLFSIYWTPIASSIGSAMVIFAEKLSMFPLFADVENVQLIGFSIFMTGVVIQMFVNQWQIADIPSIHLDTFDIEEGKGLEWNGRRHVRHVDAFYIELRQETTRSHKYIERVFPTITWFTTDGIEIASNHGRWWISKVHEYTDTATLQAVSLDPNGQPKRLYFAKRENGKLDAWHRTADNKEPITPIKSGEFRVSIKLESNSGSAIEFNFWVTNTKKSLKLEQLTHEPRQEKNRKS